MKRKERKAPGSGRQQTQTREADAAVTAGGLKITASTAEIKAVWRI